MCRTASRNRPIAVAGRIPAGIVHHIAPGAGSMTSDKVRKPGNRLQHPRGGAHVTGMAGYAQVDDIVAAQCHRQSIAVQRQDQPAQARTFRVAANAPGLIELARAIFAGIGRMGKETDHAAAGIFGNPIGPGQQLAAFQFEPQPIGKGAAKRDLEAWQQGRTGYPIVDAGMRQLWATGWMHNRVRMIAASFLVKHLRLSWGHGARWFWDTLVDADLASNTLGWQWTAGCGADAAPYFRVFAPVLQGLKFDPEGSYVRRWVPELDKLPAENIHAPWEAPAPVLAAAGIRLGKGGNYPAPIVDHATARNEALAAFRRIRGGEISVRE